MDFKLSRKISAVDDALISEIFKLADDPSMIPFGGGNPFPALFPKDDVTKIACDILSKDPVGMLQYASSEGYIPLIETLKNRMRDKYGIDRDHIFITTGAQQAADLVAKCLLDEGDTVICEGYSYMSTMDTFRTYGAHLVGVPLEEDGMDLQKLEEALIKNPDTKLIYIIPTFQNPTGITTSLKKRKAIYDLAVKYDVVILEDDPYSDIRFNGEPILPIKSFDTDGRVIYCVSFSKVIAPALRVGFMCVDEGLIPRLITGKQCTDIHTVPLTQHICHEFLTKYDYDAHICKISALYSEKCALMLDEMYKHFPENVKYTRPDGGMFIMVYLPEGTDSEPFVRKAIENGVACIPGSTLIPEYGISNAIRLNFSTPTREEIIKGIGILAEMMKGI